MKMDLLIKNANVFNVYFKKFIKGNVYISEGKFQYVYDEISDVSPKKIIDAEGKFLIPGLIDIHMHIESSMTTPYQFSQGAIKAGTTTIVSDPHEIANVAGVEGIKEMINLSKNTFIDIFYGIPSSVPATTSFLETTGGEIIAEDIEDLLEHEEIICLGEVMNMRELLGDETTRTNSIINAIKDKSRHLKLEGHCPKITGPMLSSYIGKGVDADHTQQSVALLEEKIKKGMFIELQKKSITQENINFLVENNLYERFAIVTDDMMADNFLDGHLNLLIKKAISLGMPSEAAIYTATYTPARRMNLYDRGAIAPGKIADFLILSDVEEFIIEAVYKNGQEYDLSNKNYIADPKSFNHRYYQSVKLKPLTEKDFIVAYDKNNGTVTCRAIKTSETTTFTQETQVNLNVIDGELNWESSDYNLVAVFERYKQTGSRAYGFVTGARVKAGAVATTYAHDHHNLTVNGRNKKDMVIAANWVIENGGGVCVVNKGEILATVSLPIGGILSDKTLDNLGYDLSQVKKALYDLGYRHNNIIMSMSTLSLPVSPALKITDKGLVNGYSLELVDLIISEV